MVGSSKDSRKGLSACGLCLEDVHSLLRFLKLKLGAGIGFRYENLLILIIVSSPFFGDAEV